MNGIEINGFSNERQKLGQTIQLQKAVLAISAHWLRHRTAVTAMNALETICDFKGFPKKLFVVQYPTPGDSAFAMETPKLIKSTNVGPDHDRN